MRLVQSRLAAILSAFPTQCQWCILSLKKTVKTLVILFFINFAQFTIANSPINFHSVPALSLANTKLCTMKVWTIGLSLGRDKKAKITSQAKGLRQEITSEPSLETSVFTLSFQVVLEPNFSCTINCTIPTLAALV